MPAGSSAFQGDPVEQVSRAPVAAPERPEANPRDWWRFALSGRRVRQQAGPTVSAGVTRRGFECSVTLPGKLAWAIVLLLCGSQPWFQWLASLAKHLGGL